jgi:hypothetical protein
MARPTNLIRTLIITAKIRDTKVRILIDSEYLDNFVSPDFVKKLNSTHKLRGTNIPFIE